MEDFQAAIERVNSIEAVPTILEVVCQTTGMGFAAVARVTEDRWIACSVLDEIQFYIAQEIALAHGGTLTVQSTSDETRFTFRMPQSDHLARKANV